MFGSCSVHVQTSSQIGTENFIVEYSNELLHNLKRVFLSSYEFMSVPMLTGLL